MSTIGGPGGIGGPKGPGGPDRPDDLGEVAEVAPGEVGRASAAAPAGDLDALAAEIAAGRMTPREAIDRMVDEAGVGLGTTERAELRELLTDLVANDPHLAGLVGRL
jgi:hypothetical protein